MNLLLGSYRRVRKWPYYVDIFSSKLRVEIKDDLCNKFHVNECLVLPTKQVDS